MDPRVRLALRIIDERNGSLRFDLAAICEMLGLTQAYFRRLLHRDTGQTWPRYIRYVRMSRAGELLRCSALPIKQIALECEYEDISNFYRDFKIVHGTTPRESRLKEVATAALGAALGANGPEASAR